MENDQKQEAAPPSGSPGEPELMMPSSGSTGSEAEAATKKHHPSSLLFIASWQHQQRWSVRQRSVINYEALLAPNASLKWH